MYIVSSTIAFRAACGAMKATLGGDVGHTRATALPRWCGATIPKGADAARLSREELVAALQAEGQVATLRPIGTNDKA